MAAPRKQSSRASRGVSPAQALRAKGWATTDDDERLRRRLRAREEALPVAALEDAHPVFGTFRVPSASGEDHDVEIRSLDARANYCGCQDFRVNGLGTCKHVEAVLLDLESRHGHRLAEAARAGAPRAEIWLDRTGARPVVRVQWPRGPRGRGLRPVLEPFFGADGALIGHPLDAFPAVARSLEALGAARRAQVRVSAGLAPWLETLQRQRERERARRDFLQDVAGGKRSTDVLRVPLYPYQREGMLHLAFTERAVLADEMGLGKTVQALAACVLARRLQGAERVLVVAPASLKTEWEEQIRQFTDDAGVIVEGPRARRLRQYRAGPRWCLVSYEQVRADVQAINESLAPDVVVLDEAQRIKNWQAKTADAVKRLVSRYAFVLTGTPLENRIDEVYSLAQMIDPELLGPLFRFNREFYVLDDRGRPAGYRNLDRLHRRLAPVLLRRRKHEVEGDLPGRTVNTYFVPLTPGQRAAYDGYREQVARLAAAAARRPPTREEQERIQRGLACMRMVCDSNYILDETDREAPKLDELDSLLDELLAEGEDHKLIVFSEWKRMLDLVGERLQDRGIDYALHTGSVPQRRRRAEINRFKSEPGCRVLLSTESGGVGLNLQVADVVVNLDLPWNPAKLEQRIGRAWRKHQQRVVQVINLVAEGTIEHEMLHRLEQKRTLAEGVIDGREGVVRLDLPSGRGAWLERVRSLTGLGEPAAAHRAPAAAPPLPPLERLRQETVARWGERLDRLEVYGADGPEPLVLAVVDAADPRLRESLVEAARGSFPGGSPRVEMLDRGAHAALQGLLAAGALQPGGAAATTVHASPDAERSLADSRAARLPRARERLAAAERPRRMAEVLAGSGFEAEAAAPLRTALANALGALEEWLGGGEAPLSAASVSTRLEAPGLVPAGTAALLGELEAAVGRGGPPPPPDALERTGAVLEAVRAVLGGSRGGEGRSPL